MASQMYMFCFVLVTLTVNYISSSALHSLSRKYQYPPGSLACKSHRMTEMDCSKRYLVDIPFLDQKLTTILDFSYNQLTEIKGAPFQQVLLLRILDLSYNHLKKINGAPFQQLPLLRKLDLSHNQITTLSSTAFRGIWSLEELKLTYNHIMALPVDIFLNLTKLEYINLHGNILPALPYYAIELRALQEIHVVFYGIISEICRTGFPTSNLKIFELTTILTSNIQNDTFQCFARSPLQAFYMIHYNLPGNTYGVERGVFAPFSNVTVIRITNEALPALGSLSSPLQALSIESLYESFTATNKSTLQVLHKFNSTLVYLAIRHQPMLQKIEDDSFIWTPCLKTLFLDYNQIHYLAKYAFRGLITLQELNLASNDLRAVPSDALGVFKTSSTLKYVDLSSNRISSDIANDAFSALSASLTTLRLSMAANLVENGLAWVNEFQQVNYLFLESIGVENAFTRSNYSLITLKKCVITSFFIHFSPCFAFPTLETLTMNNVHIRNFPVGLALHRCSHLRKLHLSHLENRIYSFDDKYLNISFTFLHTLKIIQSKMTSIN